jgi:hypothetical protein
MLRSIGFFIFLQRTSRHARTSCARVAPAWEVKYTLGEHALSLHGIVLIQLPRNTTASTGSGLVPSLVRGVGWGGTVLNFGSAAYVCVGTTSLECSVLKCGQVYSTLCCLLIGISHSDCITYCIVTAFPIMSCLVHIAIVIWCHALVSVGNVFRSGSSSERDHRKRTASRALHQRLSFRTAKVMRHQQ